MVEKVTRIWNDVEMSFRGEFVTISGFSEVILEVLKGPIGANMVEKVLKIWNHVEMSIMGEVITISGSAEALLEVLKVLFGWAWSKKCLGFEITYNC